jgi:putative oxidoreductase
MFNKSLAQTILRVLLGLLFVVPGLGKIMNPAMIIGLLGDIGFPGPVLFGWILILSEIIFGAALVIGYKVKLTAWPPVIILAVAILTVHLKNLSDPMGMINVLFHLVGIAGLIVIATAGPGAYALSKN